MRDMNAEQTVLQQIIDRFPTTFGLRHFPGKRFQINSRMSYTSGDLEPQLVVDIINPETGECLIFSRCSEHELANQITFAGR